MTPTQPFAVTGVLSILAHPTLAFELLHREPLYVHALRSLVSALGRDPLVVVERPDLDRVVAEVARVGLPARVVPVEDWWEAVTDRHRALLVHDALCPLAAPEFLARVAGSAPGTSVVAYRPVTDTVKTVLEGAIHGTIDREGLAAVTSPLLVAGDVLGTATEPPPLADVAALTAWLRARGPVELTVAPALARRVDDVSAVTLLECVDELSHQVVSGGPAARTP